MAISLTIDEMHAVLKKGSDKFLSNPKKTTNG